MSTTLLLLALPLSAWGQASTQEPVKGRVGWVRQKDWADTSTYGYKTGFMFELLDKMTEREKLQFEYREASDLEELEDLISSGKIDMFIEDTSAIELPGVTVLHGGIGYARMQLLCSRPDDARFSAENFEALNGKKLAVQAKTLSKTKTEIFEQSKGFSTEKLYYSSKGAVKQALLSGTADLAVLDNCDDTSCLAILAKFGLAERHIVISDGRQELIKAVHDELGEILQDNPLYLHKLTLKYSRTQKMGTLALSKKEMAFIRDAPAIDIYVRNDLPMYNVEKDGAFTGYFPILLETISKDTGLKFNIRGYDDTDKLASEFKDAANPFSLCVLPGNDIAVQAGNLRPTRAATSFTLLLMTRKGYKQDIRTVAYNRGSHLEDILSSNGFTAIEREDGLDALTAVLKRETDAALVENYVGQILISRRKFRKSLAVRFFPIMTCDLVFAELTAADGTLVTIMNKALENLSEEELWSYTRASSALNQRGISFADFVTDNWYILLLGILLVLAALVIIIMQQRFNKKLEISNRNKDVFLADLSHDFRTPLTAISGFAYLGKSESDPRYYPDIITSVSYMQELVNDILNIRQYSEGKSLELQPEAIIAGTLYDSILSVMHGRAAAKKIQIDFKSNISYPYVSIDPMRVRQVFVNIIGNAIKYSPAGSTVEVNVEDYLKAHDVRLRATITDHGEGMSKDFIKRRMFRPFEREKNAFSAKEGGSGLGLAITKIIMDRLGGSISVESELGKGSTFTLDFPETTITKEVYDQTHKDDNSPKNKEYDFSGLNVLLCEDNEINTYIVTNLLQKKGCTVDSAENGKLGLEKFRDSPQGHYGLILMDIRMPEMDGIEAAQAIRAMQREDAQKIPIIALSANAFEEDKMQSAKAGMNAHLSKPIDVDALFRTVEQLLILS